MVFVLFGLIMFVIWFDKVGEVVVLCEILIIFVVFIGVVFLKEIVGLCCIVFMGLIVFGVVIVEMGG